jgi:hypothetical protein
LVTRVTTVAGIIKDNTIAKEPFVAGGTIVVVVVVVVVTIITSQAASQKIFLSWL